MLRISRVLGAITLAGSLTFGFAPNSQAAPANPSASVAASRFDAANVTASDRAVLTTIITPAFLAKVDAQRTRLNLAASYQCGATPLTNWFAKKNAALTVTDRNFLADTGADTIAALDAEIYGTTKSSAYALGPHAGAIRATFAKLKGFWNVQTPNVALLGMHSTAVLSTSRVARIGRVVYGFSATDSTAYAKYVVNYVKASKGLSYGRSPLLSAGAFTVTPKIEPGISARIVMGDGILAAYDALGMSTTAPQYILSHEFGHSVQSAGGLFNKPVKTASASRYAELMADASASYFVAQPSKGLKFTAAKMSQVIAASYDAGDCAFTAVDHHGTPMQRKRSATWAYSWEKSLRPVTKVATYATFKKAFDGAYAAKILPDS